MKSLNFAESNAHRKTNPCGSFETYNLFFSLILKDSMRDKTIKLGKKWIQ